MTKLLGLVPILAAAGVHANNGIPESYFTDNNGIAAANAAGPMWNMASGSCLPVAAEDGQEHQTNGIDVPVVLCGINQNLAAGCPDSKYVKGSRRARQLSSGNGAASMKLSASCSQSLMRLASEQACMYAAAACRSATERKSQERQCQLWMRISLVHSAVTTSGITQMHRR